MNSILNELAWDSAWAEFFAYKSTKGHLSKRDSAQLSEFIASGAYSSVVEGILQGKGLSIPEKKLINKMGKTSKRVVYSFSPDEMMVLKLLNFLLCRYDDKQPEGVYSFRQGAGVHRAIKKLASMPDINHKWCYKADISNYFGSIDISLLLPILKEVLLDEPLLFAFLSELLSCDEAIFEGTIVHEPRGVMAGTPISPFLANLYLGELDSHFLSLGVPYVRYSDDIILFANSKEEAEQYKNDLYRIITKYNLCINPEKEQLSSPDEGWTFLGVEFNCGKIELSEATKSKIKGKIRRRASSLRRWMLRKNAEPKRAMGAMMRTFNSKFFDSDNANDLTWSRWFFPLVTQAEGFKEIDLYLQQWIRWIPTGRHSKANFNISYQELKAMGYRSLVHEYYASMAFDA